jgi:predicted AAA+ superfamily ATPase
VAWKSESNRKPLLIRGARQVGKSHLVREFGSSHFDQSVEVNLEQKPELRKIFEQDLDPKRILGDLSLALGVSIEVDKTLLFLDEIQTCPKAIMALRYFYEQLPELHVIAAGSLIEFALQAENFSMPVGRVESLFLYPLRFSEFLIAKGEQVLLEFLQSQASIHTPIAPVVHEKGLRLVREFSIAGGMPEATESYIVDPASLRFRQIQQGLLQSFRDDFGKYAKSAKHSYLEKVFLTAPRLISTDYKYSKVDRDIPSRELKDALLLLEKAGIITRIKATSGAGIPLEAYADNRKFKLAFLDIGLVQAALGLDSKAALQEDLIAINAGAVAEQFVSQELLSTLSPSYEHSRLYYWTRAKGGSSAEVDLLYQLGEIILPLEVKAGATGRLKSLRIFLDSYSAPFGIRISAHPLSFHDQVLSVPFYLINSLEKLVREALEMAK